MYKIIQFSDGSESMAEEVEGVEVEFFRDNATPVTAIYTENKPEFKKGKHIISGKKTVIDLTDKKQHTINQRASEPSNTRTI